MKKVTVRECGREDFRDRVALLRTRVDADQYVEYPESFDVEWHTRIWDWLDHPPPGEKPRRRTLADGDDVVGYLAAAAQYYRIAWERVIAHTPADYMVLPGYGLATLIPMRRFGRLLLPRVEAAYAAGEVRGLERGTRRRQMYSVGDGEPTFWVR